MCLMWEMVAKRSVYLHLSECFDVNIYLLTALHAPDILRLEVVLRRAYIAPILPF